MTSRTLHHLTASARLAALAEDAMRHQDHAEASTLVRMALSRLQLAGELDEREWWRWRVMAA